MADPIPASFEDAPRIEGKVNVIADPSGGEIGPGFKAPVFYNPAMVQNRDLSVLIMQTLIDNGRIPGQGEIDILDGLTGSGIRAVRFAMELISEERDLKISGVDLKDSSIESARELAASNSVDVDFEVCDLNSHYGNRRFHYIDIDPFGTPVPFIQNALIGARRGGVVAITATDTAALTGSVPRVSRRRYGIGSTRTHFMQELGARSLLGHITRIGASFEISVRPLYFYSQDHFIRGYVEVNRGAKRSDASLLNVGWFDYDIPKPPMIHDPFDPSIEKRWTGRPIGPVWTGPLSDIGFVKECLDEFERRSMDHLFSSKVIKRSLSIALEEDLLPPGGFDLNETSRKMKTSPPSIDTVSAHLEGAGFKWSRSRFSPTLIKTDAPWDHIISIFTADGGE